jgi:hypothetical protein
VVVVVEDDLLDILMVRHVQVVTLGSAEELAKVLADCLDILKIKWGLLNSVNATIFLATSHSKTDDEIPAAPFS